MFEWGNWLIQTIIAAFFVSGFVVFDSQRLIPLWDLYHRRPLTESTVSLLFTLLMIAFSLMAANFNPSNQMAYYNWALYICVVPGLTKNQQPWQMRVRGLVLLGLLLRVTNDVTGLVIAVVSIGVALTVMYRYRPQIRNSLGLNLAFIGWLGFSFWLTQARLTLVVGLMGGGMFMLMHLFTTIYWTGERLASLEHTRLRQQVEVDTLTKAGSLFAFQRDAQAAFWKGQHQHKPPTLIMFDIDHFKRVNDTYGHAAGNMVLAGVAKLAQEHCEVPLYRTGGEEFNVLFEQSLGECLPLVQELHQVVGSTVFESEDQAIQVTLSIGVTTLQPADTNFQSVYERADSGLYRAKNSGRNRIVIEGHDVTAEAAAQQY